jgi:hypothetical protein
MTKYFCDRCTKEIRRGVESAQMNVVRPIGAFQPKPSPGYPTSPQKAVLCAECSEALDKFLRFAA